MHRVKNIFLFSILKIIYHSLIASHLNYCSIVYLDTFWKHLKPLQVLQEYLEIFHLNLQNFKMFQELKHYSFFLNLLDLKHIQILNISIWYFQIQNSNNNFYDKSLLILLPSSDSWQSLMYQIPFVSSERSRFLIGYQIPFIANNHKLNDKILF